MVGQVVVNIHEIIEDLRKEQTHFGNYGDKDDINVFSMTCVN